MNMISIFGLTYRSRIPRNEQQPNVSIGRGYANGV